MGFELAQPDVRVLVVHSDPADLAVVASVIAAHAFDLRVLESSDRLVIEVVRYQPDAVVLDVKQRDSDGYELCLALKTDPLTAGVAVILTGSLDGPEARRRAFTAGCDDFLEKPIHRHVLAYRLRSFARLRRAWLRAARPGPIVTADRLLRACQGFGAYAGLMPAEQAALARAALVHGIGEVGIPEARPDTALLVGIVRHHHERCDGGGYPDGLVGEAIPRLARMFRILDMFDAVTRERPYQAARSRAQAVAILRRDAEHGGVDPMLLAVFEGWLDQSEKQPHQIEP